VAGPWRRVAVDVIGARQDHLEGAGSGGVAQPGAAAPRRQAAEAVVDRRDLRREGWSS